jgi:hypothetical protein
MALALLNGFSSCLSAPPCQGMNTDSPLHYRNLINQSLFGYFSHQLIMLEVPFYSSLSRSVFFCATVEGKLLFEGFHVGKLLSA